MTSPARTFKARLRADLKAAMQAGHGDETRLLRVLVAAIDNAEAVPVAEGPYVERAFGDDAVEVPRRQLSAEDLSRLLQTEVDVRLAAADDYARLGRPDEAARLAAEAKLVARYRRVDQG